MSTIQQTRIGNITTTSTSSLTLYSVPCNLEKPHKVSCILLDKKGINLWEQSSHQPKGTSKIDLQLPLLRPGTYNCWVKIEDKMHLRQLHVASGKRKGLLGQLMKHFE